MGSGARAWGRRVLGTEPQQGTRRTRRERVRVHRHRIRAGGGPLAANLARQGTRCCSSKPQRHGDASLPGARVPPALDGGRVAMLGYIRQALLTRGARCRGQQAHAESGVWYPARRHAGGVHRAQRDVTVYAARQRLGTTSQPHRRQRAGAPGRCAATSRNPRALRVPRKTTTARAMGSPAGWAPTCPTPACGEGPPPQSRSMARPRPSPPRKGRRSSAASRS